MKKTEKSWIITGLIAIALGTILAAAAVTGFGLILLD